MMRAGPCNVVLSIVLTATGELNSPNCWRVVLCVLLAAIGQSHWKFLEASSGPRSMA